MISLKLSLLTLLIAAPGLVTCSDKDLEKHVRITCEGSSSALNCGNEVIHIIGANYGRTDKKTCSKGVPEDLTRDTNCHAPTALSVVAARCNVKTSCFLEASNSVFGDPCVGTFKYLAVSYVCHPKRTVVTCEGIDATLSCGAGHLKIHSANYGRTDFTTCSAGKPDSQITNTDCYAADTLAEVRKRCKDKRTCRVPATNAVFSDPCFGTFKYLRIVYSCVGYDKWLKQRK